MSLNAEHITADPVGYLHTLAPVVQDALTELEEALAADDRELMGKACRRLHSCGVLAYSTAAHL